jgi:DNA-binding beta-propeller fold protein YncE
MSRKILSTIYLMMISLLVGSLFAPQSQAEVEWNIQRTLNIDGIPIDVALAPDGSKVFVLTDQGKVLVYSNQNEPTDEFEVGRQIDQINVGPRGDLLILGSQEKKTVQIASLDFIQNIPIAGSPFKGPADAPVVIAVFDDFQ